MRFWILCTALLLTPYALSQPLEAKCTILAGGGMWLVVRDGDEAIEYSVRSSNEIWALDAHKNIDLPCTNCGKIYLSLDMPGFRLAEQSKQLLKNGLLLNGPAQQVRLGPLKGEAQRFTSNDATSHYRNHIVLEAHDGCVMLEITVSGENWLNSSPFKDIEAILESTVIERIQRGPASAYTRR